MADLTCPKCQSPMSSYERNAITVDQCTGCRGVFLDRGELERLVDAESAFYGGGGGGAPAAPPPRGPEPRREPYREPYREEHRGYGHGGYGHKRHKKEGFLGELFDF